MRLLLLLFLVQPAWAQYEAKVGDPINFRIHISDEGVDFIQVYRKAKPGNSSTLLTSIPASPNVWAYNWIYRMPDGKPTQYRFFVVPKRNEEELPGSNEVIVKRIP